MISPRYKEFDELREALPDFDVRLFYRIDTYDDSGEEWCGYDFIRNNKLLRVFRLPHSTVDSILDIVKNEFRWIA